MKKKLDIKINSVFDFKKACYDVYKRGIIIISVSAILLATSIFLWMAYLLSTIMSFIPDKLAKDITIYTLCCICISYATIKCISSAIKCISDYNNNKVYYDILNISFQSSKNKNINTNSNNFFIREKVILIFKEINKINIDINNQNKLIFKSNWLRKKIANNCLVDNIDVKMFSDDNFKDFNDYALYLESKLNNYKISKL